MLKVGIIGMGCIGSILAKYLSSNTSIQLHYFSKTPKTKITISHLNQETTIPILLEDISTFSEKIDWLLICLKKYHYNNASHVFTKLISKNTKVVIFRNGLNLKEDITYYTHESYILETIIDSPINRLSENHYIQFSAPKISLTDEPLSYQFKQLTLNTDIEIAIIEDFKTVQWKKLIESATTGSIQTLKRKTAAVFKDPKVQFLLKQSIAESIKVAIRDGAKVDEEFEQVLFEKIISYPETKSNSMLNDLNNGKQLEINAKVGAIYELAIAYNIHSPLIEQFHISISKLNEEILANGN